MGRSEGSADLDAQETAESVTVVLRREAETDLDEARNWYETQRTGLGDEFIQEVDAVLRRIGRTPRYFPKIHGEVRRALVRRFPFAVYFVRDRRRSIIIGVLHHRRNPAEWQRRTEV
jgi:plasmid stabilization system protein ParE